MRPATSINRETEERPVATIMRTRARRLILTGILAASLGASPASATETATTSATSHPATTTSSASHEQHAPR
jgi:hypothetical protein